MTPLFLSLENDPFRLSLDETNDCSVIAAAIVLGISYKEAHEFLKIRGRQNRSGIFSGDLLDAIYETKQIEDVTDNLLNHGKTVRTIERANLKECYIMLIKQHVLVMKDGLVHD